MHRESTPLPPVPSLLVRFRGRIAGSPLLVCRRSPAYRCCWAESGRDGRDRFVATSRIPRRPSIPFRIVIARGSAFCKQISVSMAAAEQVWEFKPEIAWKAGDYRFRVLSTLEDLAGNQIGKPFEVDLFEEIDDQGKPKTHWVNLPFTIPAS